MTCLFCRGSLGTNDLLPELPLGKRFAFDPANDRLWIVCPKCSRWNIAPLDDAERRATVARLEQFYVATPRAEMHGIGVAEVKGGASLIRIGDVTWSQFAAWRYGQRLKERRRSRFIAMPITLAAVVFIWSPIGDAILEKWWGIGALYVCIFWMLWRYAWRALFRVPDEQGALRAVRLTHLGHTAIAVEDNRWRLLVSRDRGISALEGLDAIRALAQVTSHLNQQGATQAELEDAIALIERAGGPRQLFDKRLTAGWMGAGNHKIMALPRPFALALEMAAHEETERLALQGELAALRLDSKEAAGTAQAAEAL